MIGEGLFFTQLETIENILREINLFEERQRFPNRNLGAKDFKGLSYREVYARYIAEFAYDFRLSDQSLLLFRKGGSNMHDGCLSFSYNESPSDVMSYLEFVADQNNINVEDSSLQEIVSFWGDGLRTDYEQYVNSMELKSAVTPIRYDYHSKDYRSGVHPASHFHFGFGSEIRVAARRVMNPISFVLFVLRQQYPEHWAALWTVQSFSNWRRNVRDNLEMVHSDYWCHGDEGELYLY